MKELKYLGKVRKDVMLKLIAGLEKERRECADRGVTPPDKWMYETKSATNIVIHYDDMYIFRSIGKDSYRYKSISTIDYSSIVITYQLWKEGR